MKRTFVLTCFAVGCWLTVFVPARSEVFLLKSGGRIEADHLNPQRQPTDPYQLRTDLGVRLDLAPAAVSRVIVKTDVQKQYEQLLPKMPNTAEGHWLMAEWCLEAGLLAERKAHLAEVIAREVDHAAARAALGYAKFGSKWMTQDEFMTSQGYVRSGGRYKLRQEIELSSAAEKYELDSKALRKQIRLWFSQLGGKSGGDALAKLQGLRDPIAAPALAEILVDNSEALDKRRLCLEILSKMRPGLVDAVLLRIAMDEQDDNLVDRALAELKRSGAPVISTIFVKELQSKDNRRVNRAARCLAQIGDKEATLPLINALVTTHEFIIKTSGSGGGGGGMPIGVGAGGPDGGLGGLSMGGKDQRIKKDLPNETVRSTLATFHPGVNYDFDKEAWRRWYIQTFTTTTADLRREE